ncbi:MAG: RNA polymerase sigma factor [Runella sp.]
MPQKKSFTTQEIVEKLRIGEKVEDITAYLYRRFEVKAIRLVQRLGGVYEDAQDVLHDSLLALLQHIQEGKFDANGVASLDTYFYSIVRNEWLNKNRGNSRRLQREETAVAMTGSVETTTPLSEMIQNDTAFQVFQRIGEKCRKILSAYHAENRPLTEIAEELQISLGALRVEKHRCMKKLSSLVNEL